MVDERAPKVLPLWVVDIHMERGTHPSLPGMSLVLSSNLSFWGRILLALMIIFRPSTVNRILTYDEVLILSRMINVYGLLRAVRLIKRRKDGI